MNEQEIAVFIAEVRKDLSYIKERVDEKFFVYDRHIDEAPSRQEKINRLEERMMGTWVVFGCAWAVVLIIIGAYFKK